MIKWEKLGVSKEIFEACERLARCGSSDNEKANISELNCDKIYAGTFDTNLVKMCNSFNNIDLNKSVYEQVMKSLVDELEEELWDIYNNAEEEEELCLSCLMRFFLEKAYSCGYQEGIRYYKYRIDEANVSIRDELLEEVSECGYRD
ncbi:hypothetical protein ACSXEK_16385 (plasmid) [Clostridium perfringens]